MTFIRRKGAAWDTPQRLRPPFVLIVMFSALRQKFCVALPASLALNASTVTAPLMVTPSGFCARPWIEVLKPMFAYTLYDPGLNRSASRRSWNWWACVSFWASNTSFSDAWIVASGVLSSKMRTFGPKSGTVGWEAQVVGVTVPPMLTWKSQSE